MKTRKRFPKISQNELAIASYNRKKDQDGFEVRQLLRKGRKNWTLELKAKHVFSFY